MTSNNISLDHRIIADFVKEGSTVLDLGCGRGKLMLLLENIKKAKVQGIEIDEKAIYECVAGGLSVFHGDIDTGLSEYKDKSFDYVILNQSLQEVRRPDPVLSEALRVGHNVIVGFPNFACWKGRWQLSCRGRAPVTLSLPYEWHDTPNLHFLSIKDFFEYCKKRNIIIQKSVFITKNSRVNIWPNLFADNGIFLIKAKS
ncbi:MAG: methionine biosynthesis protein MetW [bacterium]